MTTKQVRVGQWKNDPEYEGKPGYWHNRVILHSRAIAPTEYEIYLASAYGAAQRVIVNSGALMDVDMEPIEEPLYKEA